MSAEQVYIYLDQDYDGLIDYAGAEKFFLAQDAENTKLKELLKKFVEDETVYWESIITDGNYYGDRCKLCEGTRDAFVEDAINHKEGCALILAKELVK